MKQLIIIAFSSLLILSCGSKTKKPVSISGSIENNSSDSIYLISNDIRKAIAITDGHFSDTLKLSTPVYFKFYTGNQLGWIYLTPGSNLSLKTDMEDFDNQLKFEGSLSKENAFLAAKVLKEIEFSKGQKDFFTLEASDFKKKSIEYKEELLTMLNKSGASKTFINSEKKNLEYNYLLMLIQYPAAYSYFSGNKMNEIPAEFREELNKVDITDEKDYNLLPSYKDLVFYNMSLKIDEAKDAEEVEKIIAGIQSQTIKDDVMSQLLMYTISSGGADAQKYFDIVQKYAKDEDLIKRANTEFEQVKKLLPGSPSPKFAYPDINGNEVALSDLKGKLVYIDVWATWCVPCLQEIPSMKKLEEDYRDKGVYFVGMSIDQRKDFEKWEKMVAEKELRGIQVFADNDWSSQFARDFNVNGIPRFILLDKEGNIITADAPRPSNPDIRTLFDEHI